jgi:hypothetical protein
LKQDISFLGVIRDNADKAGQLSKFSLYQWWFPTEIQEVMETLMARKPVEKDLDGLLALIMFAGIDFNEEDELFFQTEVIDKVFRREVKVKKRTTKVEDVLPSNFLFDSQQNLSVLLFGITFDDVRKTNLILAKSSVLTILYCCRVLVS